MSTEQNVGRILLLVGALVALFMGLMMLGFMAFMLVALGPAREAEMMPAFFSIGFMGFMGLLGIAGSIVAFMGWSVAAKDPRKAGVLGIVATVLPPTNLIAMAGGILLLISPEGKAQAAGHGAAAAAHGPGGP